MSEGERKPIMVRAEVVTVRSLGAALPGDGRETDLIRAVIPVEVLTVHFEKGTMRVRYTQNYYGEEKVTTVNIPADPFFEQYDVVKIPS